MTQSSYTINELVTLYALVGRIRLSASEQVVRAAEDVVKLIVARYWEANLTLEDLRVTLLEDRSFRSVQHSMQKGSV
jgi:capsule polysaccharide export protein KpsE/RkpR